MPVALPPYSPDFNPIEKAFAILKAILRAKAERTVEGLWNTVGQIVTMFEPQECANYFRSCGYDPELNGCALGSRVRWYIGYGERRRRLMIPWSVKGRMH